MRCRYPVLLCLALTLWLSISCTKGREEKTGDQLSSPPRQIVTTTGMITDIVRRVAGEDFTVTGLMKSGVDPHLYKPTRSDIALLTSAEIVFYNGLLLEGKMTDALMRVASSGRAVVSVTEQIEAQYLLEPPEFAGHYDPHVWMDPQAWTKAIEVVRDKLADVFPDSKLAFASRAQKLIEELTALDRYAEEVLHSVPPSSRVLITAHDAFNYFGRRYGYEVIGIQGISTESEAGVKDIERIVGLIVERKIAAVFVETTVSERNVRALIEGAAARGVTVTIGGNLFSDAMGDEGSYTGTYLGMIDHNVTTISRALGGTAPQGGWRGLLSQNSAPTTSPELSQ